MRRGFTLVEMLTIIAVIGVLVGATWPLIYPAQQRARAKLAAEQVADELRLAQEQTLSEQDIFGVQFNVAQGQITVVNYGESYDGASDVPTTVETKTLDPIIHIDGTTLIDPNTGNYEVRFAKTGVSSITGTLTVVDTAGKGNTSWTVEVAPSGLVKVYE